MGFVPCTAHAFEFSGAVRRPLSRTKDWPRTQSEHSSAAHPAFEDAYDSPRSRFTDWYVFTDTKTAQKLPPGGESARPQLEVRMGPQQGLVLKAVP